MKQDCWASNTWDDYESQNILFLFLPGAWREDFQDISVPVQEDELSKVEENGLKGLRLEAES